MNRREFLGVTATATGAIIISGCGSDDDTVSKSMVLRKSIPNPNSAIDALYKIEAEPSLFSYGDIVGAGDEESKLINNALTTLTNHKVRIFHVNDMHNHSVDPSSSKGDTNRLAQLAKKYKDALVSASSNETILLLSSGDDHIGNVLDELMGFNVNTFVTDPAYSMYSALGFSAVAIGNHELDKGGELLKKCVEHSAKMPLLSANIAGSKYLTSAHYVPAVVLLSKGLRIGVVGLTTPNETAAMTQEDPNRVVTNPANAIKSMIPQMEKCCDMIIILSHLGFGGEVGQVRHDAEVADIDIAQIVASLTKKPTIILGGHSHSALNINGLESKNIINGVLIAQAGGNGTYFGEILSTITVKSKDASTITHESVKLHKVKARDDRAGKHDPNVNETNSDIDTQFKANVTDPILALLRVKLEEKLATIEHNNDISIESTIADRYMRECAVANFMNDAIVEQSKYFPGREGKGIDLAAFNASGVSTGIENKSHLTFQDWYAVMPYADSIYLTDMNGEQIKAMVESNVTRMLLPKENSKNGGIFDVSGFISWGFLHFSKALTYKVSYNEATRSITASDIKMNGVSINDQLTKVFKVSFSSYIASGSEYWNGSAIGAAHPGNGTPYNITKLSLHNTGLVYRNEIISYIVSKGVLGVSSGAKKDNRITFA